MPQKIILASASPRRKELMQLITNSFEIIPSNFDESLVPAELCPVEHVIYSSKMKALDISSRYKDSIVIGCDTIVTIDNTILGKPKDKEQAKEMLSMLSGNKHRVLTGICIAINNESEIDDYEATIVNFAELDENIIDRYIASNEPMDKAGAYAIQGKGSVLIKSIEGCFFNVVGLPIYKLSRMLEKYGVCIICE
ncbi:MAG: Maf family protein [Armatimonadota bacterium]